jgi:hypothetical protein
VKGSLFLLIIFADIPGKVGNLLASSPFRFSLRHNKVRYKRTPIPGALLYYLFHCVVYEIQLVLQVGAFLSSQDTTSPPNPAGRLAPPLSGTIAIAL